MDNNTTSVLKLTTVNNKTLYVKIQWKENENDVFHIKIFDGSISWTGRFSNAFAQNYMKRLDKTETEYRNSVKDALTESNNNFLYELSDITGDTISAKFSWRKLFQNSTNSVTKVEYGCVPVHQNDVLESKDLLIDFLLDENKDLKQTVNEFKHKNTELQANLDECRIKLKQFMDIKTSLETNLYGKFVQLLNAKKRKIELLEENLLKVGLENNDDQLD